ncbi:unnamed protein product [Prorocentrum cordatum]|uniref:Uncharacterized protein n=1 Tax=Prorocentrum cordatum TaxID=2364126 RepID=A0ABN9WDK9_9DINO|nr:unnamed protein product [Polarella glacialis]
MVDFLGPVRWHIHCEDLQRQDPSSFHHATVIVPTLYSIVWFCVWGTEGIRMQRMADSAGLCSQAHGGGSSWSDQYNLTDKQNLSMGWTPGCVLDDAYHGGYGRCKRAKFTRYVDPS